MTGIPGEDEQILLLRLRRASAQDDQRPGGRCAQDDKVIPADLAQARASIDNLDAALVHLLAERFKITQQIGQIKAAAGLPPADPAREVEQIARLRQLAQESDLDPEFAEKFLTFIVREVVRHHERLQGSDWVSG
jgi:chorismate mutase